METGTFTTHKGPMMPHAAQRTSLQTYIFEGALTAVGPLATCGPSASKAAGSGPKPIPKVITDRGEVMYMPAMGFRSKLRGACTKLVAEALQASQRKMLSLQDAQLLRLGGIKQGGAEARVPFEAFQEMLRTNPVLSVFGSSTPWVEGKLMVGHMYCKEIVEHSGVMPSPMLVDGVRANFLRREPRLIEYLNDEALQAHNEFSSAVIRSVEAKAKLKALDAQWKAEPDKQKRLELKASFESAKSEAKSELVVPEGIPLAGYEAIPAGSTLEQKIRLRNASDIEFGCLLAGLERFALEPLLGAHVAHGCGEISGDWSITIRGTHLGTVRMVPWVGLDFDSPGTVMQDALAQFKRFLSSSEMHPWTPEFMKALAAGGDEE